jgi:hypothetical protein
MADNILSIGTVPSSTPPSPAPGPLRLRGAWDSTVAYVPNDVVTYNDALYGAKVGNSNVTPVDGFTWQLLVALQDYPIAIFFPGSYGSNATLANISAVRAFTLPVNCAGSVATLATASTGTAVFKIKKNGSQIGTITFTTSSTGVFALSSGATFNVADLLTISAPTSPDASAAGFAATLLGTRIL